MKIAEILIFIVSAIFVLATMFGICFKTSNNGDNDCWNKKKGR